MKQQFLTWWTGLQQREQQLVAAASIVVVIGLFYWLLWQPLHQAKSEQQQAVQAARQQLEQLQQAIPQLAAASASGVQRSGGSLSQIISNSARSNSVSVSRMQPQNDQLQLVLEDTSFEQLIKWLHQLQYQHGVNVINLDLATTEKPGMVRVRRMVVE